MTKTVSVNHRTFQTLAIQSLRYCMGRRTFAVKDCVELIRGHWQDLTKHAKDIIIRDLDEALQSHEDDLRDNRGYCYLGDQCDYQKWKNLREWINEQA
ncbi:preprotein translocase subunit SecG [Glaesserella parasuis]|uniref:hypothetical protein n=2 Tax=Glaesserella parasuis TaxID=738 RepID=UPI0003AC0417|nr:hypothetical protein [Glaesserella parasuis]EQA13035.1 preprotein translocase subunit SecG [Glaesserella parasuis 174]MCT8560125.1 preprotein translocase subunit SecG [Glaesserella parasuis]MCT8568508.1 preprotein translocase subunit SecG [Glaesserella parasuis]MCT8673543.1 preprotein translocase subunit SecG [Glaesserella parasuis]MCT8687970.1 preprotein translocase subunit SecG [Glaesserella parasuis]